ncbi:hypothetical protein M501DRAFT_995427 [Patellaria atrata CBS 101060]|uniref:Uncharacterized protein n=1 Tax=Patellaria atrata CBS 101060 TaxID=1346257 RepID=A0A9P4S7H6_9PEZI|nr:hypothetical protein M501DRAFT_995427 [Patellaria atrata CBS 101060]
MIQVVAPATTRASSGLPTPCLFLLLVPPLVLVPWCSCPGDRVRDNSNPTLPST